MNDPTGPASNPDPNVRYDVGGWISGPCLPGPAWHVLISHGAETASYVVRTSDALTAAAIAGAQHGGSIDAADVEPWTAQ